MDTNHNTINLAVVSLILLFALKTFFFLQGCLTQSWYEDLWPVLLYIVMLCLLSMLQWLAFSKGKWRSKGSGEKGGRKLCYGWNGSPISRIVWLRCINNKKKVWVSKSHLNSPPQKKPLRKTKKKNVLKIFKVLDKFQPTGTYVSSVGKYSSLVPKTFVPTCFVLAPTTHDSGQN